MKSVSYNFIKVHVFYVIFVKVSDIVKNRLKKLIVLAKVHGGATAYIDVVISSSRGSIFFSGEDLRDVLFSVGGIRCMEHFIILMVIVDFVMVGSVFIIPEKHFLI